MSTQIASAVIGRKGTVEKTGRVQRLVLFVLFLVCGVAIFVFGSNYSAIFPTNKNFGYSAVLSAVFLVAAVWLKHNERLNKYWQVAFAFFIASFVFPVTLLFGGWSGAVLGWFILTTSTSQGIAIAKLYEMVMIEGLGLLQRTGAAIAFVGGYSPAANALYASVMGKEFDLSEPWIKEW